MQKNETIRFGFLFFYLICLLGSCQQPTLDDIPSTYRVAVEATSATESPSVTSLPFISPTIDSPTMASATSTPTTTPTPTPTPTETVIPTIRPTPHLLHEFTIQGMRERIFEGGQITQLAILEETDTHIRSYISYPSDGLTITGIMHVPHGDGEFPVLLLLHGYADREQYYAGLGTWQAADYFARQGYIVIAPDYRSWGESDSDISLFHMGLVADVLNLISSIRTVPQADGEHIGLWGHSMGGGIATKVLTVDRRVKAAVLYAPNSADDADLIDRWGIGCLAHQSQNGGDFCDPAEVIPTDSSPELIEAYKLAGADPFFLRKVSPIDYLEFVEAPIQIHIGSADGEYLAETPPDWSAKLANALIDHGREVDYFTYEGQGHFFFGESWTALLNRSLELYDQELKPSS